MGCAIWYHLYNLKNVNNTHRGVLPFVNLQAEACNFANSKTSPWFFLTFLNCTNGTQSGQGSQLTPHGHLLWSCFAPYFSLLWKVTIWTSEINDSPFLVTNLIRSWNKVSCIVVVPSSVTTYTFNNRRPLWCKLSFWTILTWIFT